MKADFLAATSVVAAGLCLVSPALAQQAESGGTSDIVVTGSRISISGYEQPTPVTVVGEEAIQRDAKPSIGDTVRELPAVGGASPNMGSGAGNIVGGTTGLDTVSLRNLGTTRTLVLFDGQRVVGSNTSGTVDLGTVPSMLVERIDVVTAGASAAWGSDAVSGVVNLVLNKRFDGFRASVDVGDSYAFDNRTYRAQVAAGTGFANGRGRIIAAVNYMDSPTVIYAKDRKWNTYTQLMQNPAYTPTNNEPRLIHMPNTAPSRATAGGLITDGPFKGIQFVGPDATPVPYDFGVVSGSLQAGGDQEVIHPGSSGLTIAYDTLSTFGYASYELTDWLTASVQLNYGKANSRSNSVPAIRQGNLRIKLDNAFLPQSVKDAAAAYNLANPDAPITEIPLGTTNLNNLSMDEKLSPDRFLSLVGMPVADVERELRRGVFTLSGDLGGGWSWEAYYQRGEARMLQYTETNVIWSKYNLAIDAVVDPATGAIVCRSTLTDPGNGCVPLSVFGTAAPSPAAVRYVNVVPGANFQRQKYIQQVVAASAQGTLPFGFEAGNIALAFGAEYREEEAHIRSDQGAADRIYSVANFPSFDGKYHVKEAFAEIEVPLLEDSFVDFLSMNAAGRITDYSASGMVETWKIGLTSNINPDIRVRGTLSRDIRAPSLSNLYSSGTSTLGSAVDPNSNVAVPIFSWSGGNPDLQPEKATTWSAGLILTPGFLPRFTLSLDYYTINLKEAIGSVSQRQVLERCNAGDQRFCPQLIFDGPVDPTTGKQLLSQINTYPQNIARLKASGLDFQADYSAPLGAGDLRFRVVGNYVFHLSQDQLGKVIRYEGVVGSDNGASSGPKLRFNSSATYSEGALSFTAQARFLGGAKLVYDWGPKDVDDNSVPPIVYADLRGSYQLNEHLQLFANVDNLLNKAPPNVAQTESQSAYSFAAVSGIHDAIGRSYRIGARLKF